MLSVVIWFGSYVEVLIPSLLEGCGAFRKWGLVGGKCIIERVPLKDLSGLFSYLCFPDAMS